jgi:hypothetical protein
MASSVTHDAINRLRKINPSRRVNVSSAIVRLRCHSVRTKGRRSNSNFGFTALQAFFNAKPAHTNGAFFAFFAKVYGDVVLS